MPYGVAGVSVLRADRIRSRERPDCGCAASAVSGNDGGVNREKMCTTGGGAVLEILALLKTYISMGFPCVFHALTGLYCPGCGGTRAVWFLLHGKIWTSIRYHPLVFYTAAMAAVEWGGYWLAKRTGRPRLYLRRYGLVVSVGVAIVLVNWVFKNYMLVVRGVDLLRPVW